MTAVLLVNARPRACVEMPPTSRPYAGKPVLSLAVADERGDEHDQQDEQQ